MSHLLQLGAEPSEVLACPLCAQPLVLLPTVATCAEGHAFDRARAGYLNLLVGGRLASGAIAGDTPDALADAARRRFLASGAYAPIAAALADTVGEVDGALFDVGCGEGYYLSKLSASSTYALDISKRAAQLAARLLPDAVVVVGNAYRLPVRDGSVDVVTSVFAPHPLEEFTRVLRPGGRAVLVTPGPRHLDEMRPHAGAPTNAKAEARRQRRAEPPEGAVSAQQVSFTLALDDAAADDLFLMTPLQWQERARPDVGSVSVDVWVSVVDAAV